MTAPIRLRARDEEDLAVIAACLQDAIIPIGDICHEPAAHRFVMVANRFKWETADKPASGAEGVAVGEASGLVADDDHLFPFERTHCGVRFEGVEVVRARGIDLKDRHQMLSLLHLASDEGGLTLTFAGGSAIRLEGRRWMCAVEDLGEPWPTANRPQHELDGNPL